MQKEISFNCQKRREYLEEFNFKYPQYETGKIGKSILGRDIDYYRMGNGKKHILAVGAHRGAEYITTSALYDFIDSLAQKATRGDTAYGINLAFLLQRFTFWVVPCVNPDGTELSLSGAVKNPLLERQVKMNGGSLDFNGWQANARGVDLSLNYTFGFREYKRAEKEKGILAGKIGFSGEYPESEPETRALADFTRTLSPSASVSLHSSGGVVFYSPKSPAIAKIAEGVARSLGYNSQTSNERAEYGGFADYSGNVLKIPSLSIGLCPEKEQSNNFFCKTEFDKVKKLLITLPARL